MDASYLQSMQDLADSARIPFNRKVLDIPPGLLMNHLIFGVVAPDVLALPHRFSLAREERIFTVSGEDNAGWSLLAVQLDGVHLDTEVLSPGISQENFLSRILSWKFEDRECPLTLLPTNRVIQFREVVHDILWPIDKAAGSVIKHWNSRIIPVIETIGLAYIILNEVTEYNLIVTTQSNAQSPTPTDAFPETSLTVSIEKGQYNYPRIVSQQIAEKSGMV